MQVLQDEIEAFTRRHEISYFETSAKSGENVHEVFYHICKFLGRMEHGNFGEGFQIQPIRSLKQFLLASDWLKRGTFPQKIPLVLYINMVISDVSSPKMSSYVPYNLHKTCS